MIRNTFFNFFIYEQSKDYYHKKEKDALDRERQQMEKDPSWKNARKDTREKFLTRGSSFSAWEFNNVIGILKIGMDGENSLTGKIYLKRRYFPRGSSIKDGSRNKTTLEKQHYLQYIDLCKKRVDINKNSSYVESMHHIIKEAEDKINKKGWFLSLPGFSFDCYDFSKACKQMKEL